jgi:malonyl-CoA/methylmalonyl-CoA synthetase
MTNMLYDALCASAEGSDRPFLLLRDGRTLSYADVLCLADRLAGALVDKGLRPGDRVAVQVRKSVEALALYAACLKAGLVFVPLNTAYTPPEVLFFLEDCGAALFVCDPSGEEAFGAPTARLGARLATLGRSGEGSLLDEAKAGPGLARAVPRGADDLAALLYTSGTTGRSKGAMLTHDNLLSNALVLVSSWRFTQEDRLIHALPIFHTHGLFVATNVTLLARASMLFLTEPDTDHIIAALPQATAMMGVPTFYTRLLADPRLTRALTAHVRVFISGSAPLLAETHHAFAERTGHRILERYGMTEAGMITSNPYEGERKAGTVGFPLPGVECRICGPSSGDPVSPGDVGVLEVRGPNVFKGYWNLPEKTRQEVRPDGFFITGDLALTDADGYIAIVGRAKDVIISGGYNIYPKEIELLLDESPAIVESAVIGVPHGDLGEVPVAVVVLSPGAVLDEPAIQGDLTTRLARFKRPRKIIAINDLPRNAMGKVQKSELRDRFRSLFLTADEHRSEGRSKA